MVIYILGYNIILSWSYSKAIVFRCGIVVISSGVAVVVSSRVATVSSSVVENRPQNLRKAIRALLDYARSDLFAKVL